MREFGVAGPEFNIKVEQEGAISVAEAIELAETAITNIQPTMQLGEVFPGSDAFNKVLRVIAMTEPANKVIDNWQGSYEELKESFTGIDPEKFIADLRLMLEGALASARRKLETATEK